jgi:hypothetical protein
MADSIGRSSPIKINTYSMDKLVRKFNYLSAPHIFVLQIKTEAVLKAKFNDCQWNQDPSHFLVSVSNCAHNGVV